MGGSGSKESVDVEKKGPHYEALLICAKHLCQKASADGGTEPGDGLISEFETKFSGGVHGFGSRLYKAIASQSPSGTPGVEGIADALGVAIRQPTEGPVDHEVWGLYWKIFLPGNAERCSRTEFSELLGEVYALSVVGLNLENEPLDAKVLEALVQSADFSLRQLAMQAESKDEPPAITLAQMIAWGESTAPRLYFGVANHIIQSIRSVSAECPGVSSALLPHPLPIKVPVLEHDSRILNRSNLWALALVLPVVYLSDKRIELSARQRAQAQASGTDSNKEEDTSEAHLHMWEKLYDSTTDGISYTGLKAQLGGYNGPTVVASLTDNEEVLGIGADVMWDEQKGFFGGVNARSFFIGHRFRVCGLSSNGSLDQPKLGTESTSLYMAFKGKHHGLGHRQMGALKDFDVLINSDLSSGMHRLGHDGLTVTKTEVKIRRIEVWGCAGAAVKSGQAEQKDWEKRHRERLIKVKRPGREFWDDNPDKALLEMAGITVNHSERGDMREPVDRKSEG